MDDTARPCGIDPAETHWAQLRERGRVLLGFCPRGKFKSLQARQAQVFALAESRGDRFRAYVSQAIDDSAAAVEYDEERREAIKRIMLQSLDPELVAQADEINRDVVKWVVKGWEVPQLPPAQLVDAQYSGRGPYSTLTDASLDVLECAQRIDEIATLCVRYWSMTPEEKKSSSLSAAPPQSDSTASAADGSQQCVG